MSYAARQKALLPLLLMLIGVFAGVQHGLSSGSKRLTSTEICQLLQGGVPATRIAALVEERGIDFDMTPQTEAQIRGAGATEDLIVTLRLASKLAGKEAPASASTLKIKSSPGRAEVYLNDVPKGATSAAGILLLPDTAPGTYRLRVELKEYEPYVTGVTLAPGKTETVEVSLNRRTSGQPRADRPSSGKQTSLSPTSAKSAVDAPRVLGEAKTLCVVIGSESSQALKMEIARELAKWGRLGLVRTPEEADLLLKVQQTGSLYKGGKYEGNQAAATLESRRSGTELWSVTKGGGWSLSSYRAGWVGRAIAKDFIKFYEATAKRASDAR